MAKETENTTYKELITDIFTRNNELLELALEFSNNYKKNKVGDYYSSNRKYHIKYCKRLKDEFTGEPLTTAARVCNETGVIELDKELFKNQEYTSDFVFFIITWCVVRHALQDSNIKEADKISLEYYLTTKRSKRSIMQGWGKLLSTVPTELNMERLKQVTEILKENNNV